jgi:hypothetical protein
MARRRPLPAHGPLLPEALLTKRQQQALPTLPKLQASARITLAKPRRRPHPIIPWLAVPVLTGERFTRLLHGGLYTVQVCECSACSALLTKALQSRDSRGRGKARLILTEIGGVGASALLIARGLALFANNLRISRTWLLAKAPGALLSTPDSRRLAAGHLVQLDKPLMTRAAAYLVARLPAPTA